MLRFLICTIAVTLSISLFSQKKMFLLIGQSNMAGRADIEELDTATLDKVFVLNNEGDFTQAKNPLNEFSTIRKGIGEQALGLGYTFARTLEGYYQDSIYLIVNARGGTEISNFSKGNATGYYQSTLDRVQNALIKYPNIKLEAILWHQGESDRDNPETYISKLKQLTADYRNDLSYAQLPFIIGDLGTWNADYGAIRAKLHQVPDSIEQTYLVSSDNLVNFDSHHFNSLGQRRLGRRYALKYLEIEHELDYKYIDTIMCTGGNILGKSETGDFWLFESDTTFIAIEVKPDSIFSEVSICEGEGYFGLRKSGLFNFNNISSLGCDSISIVNLKVNPVDTLVIDSVLLDLDEFKGYSESGSYYRKFISSSGCDSLINYNLTFTFTVAPLSIFDASLFQIEHGEIRFKDLAVSTYDKVILCDLSGKEIKKQRVTEKLTLLPGQVNIIILHGQDQWLVIKLVVNN